MPDERKPDEKKKWTIQERPAMNATGKRKRRRLKVSWVHAQDLQTSAAEILRQEDLLAIGFSAT